MTQTLEAVFENGAFHLVAPPAVPLVEGQRVRLTVDTGDYVEELLALAGQVYEGLSEDEIDDVERIALDRRHFFTAPAE